MKNHIHSDKAQNGLQALTGSHAMIPRLGGSMLLRQRITLLGLLLGLAYGAGPTGCVADTTTYNMDIEALVSDPDPDGTPYLVYLYASGPANCSRNDPDPECLHIDSGTVEVPGEILALSGVLEDVRDDCIYGIFVGALKNEVLDVYGDVPWTALELGEPYARSEPLELELSEDINGETGNFTWCASSTGFDETVSWL